jgi:hypothetical protein
VTHRSGPDTGEKNGKDKRKKLSTRQMPRWMLGLHVISIEKHVLPGRMALTV